MSDTGPSSPEIGPALPDPKPKAHLPPPPLSALLLQTAPASDAPPDHQLLLVGELGCVELHRLCHLLPVV